MTRSKRRGIQSIDTGIRLLEVLEKAHGPLALKELSAKAELDPSGAHRYLASFVRSGLVAQGGVNCPFTFTNSKATMGTDGQVAVNYSGNVCGIPVSGTETVKK